MTTKYTTSSAGWMIADPAGNIIAAAADKDTAIARAGISDIRAGNPGIRPEGAYTIYLCNQDIVDYFRLRSPRPILWVDIDFTPVGIAHMRLKRSSADPKVSRTISIHAHAYYRLRSLSPNHGMASFLDELVDFYLESTRISCAMIPPLRCDAVFFANVSALLGSGVLNEKSVNRWDIASRTPTGRMD